MKLEPTAQEEWRAVIGFEGRYEVSNCGRVRGIGPRGRGVRKAYITPLGYAQICLYVRKGKTKSVNVHSLVADAFIGPLPPGKMCCHGDGDGSHNHVSNLRYDTPAGNSADRLIHGTNQPGEKNHQAKLTDAAARKILSLKGSAPYRQIAADFSVSFTTIQKIMSGTGWQHVRTQ